MNLAKKAISAATSAALLASLLATAVAPSALASVSVGGVGNIAQGATSATTASFTFVETDVNTLLSTSAVPLFVDVTITPAAPGAGTVTFVGTPAIDPLGTPGSVGASVSMLAPNAFEIKLTGHDPSSIESVKVIGLKIAASAGASPGAIVATAGGTGFGAFAPTTSIARGKLAQAYGIGTTTWLVAVDATSACDFFGTNDVTVGGEVRTVTSVTAKDAAGQQTFVTNAFAVNHLANDVVTQTVPLPGPGTNCTATNLDSPGTVINAADFETTGNPVVFPGENTARAADVTLKEPAAGFLVAGTVVTITITTPGVTFSTRPTVAPTANLTSGLMVLSADRLSATFTVGSVATAVATTFTITNIFYDVAATVPGGTFIQLKASLSGTIVVSPNTANNALVNRGVTAAAGAATVFIGENAQKSGLVTITELQKGFFTDGLGANNTIDVCLPGAEFFTSPGPWAKVTSGDLRLREGDVASPDNIVAGSVESSTLFGDFCYKWTVWTASTVASTITIGNADFSSGPLIDVPSTLGGFQTIPGSVTMDIFIGTDILGIDSGDFPAATVVIATRVFRNQVAVTALSQPIIAAGSTDAHAGDIQVAETANGQLKAGEEICFEVRPRVSNETFQDTYLKALATADIPVATAGGGVVIGPVTMSTSFCNGSQPDGNVVFLAATHTVSFSFEILQQSVNGTGKVVVTNIHYITTADAPTGNVLVNAFGLGGAPTSLVFQATVSNAKIGNKPSISIGAVSALGANPSAGYTTKSPKVQKLRKYVTWKFTGGTALAGQRVNVMVATKINGAWGGPKYFASRTADANGIVTFWWKFNTAAAVNVRVQWPGDAGHGSSMSVARGAYWK